jgi:hypothetical protein
MLQDVASHAIPEVNSSGYQLDLSEVRPALAGHATLLDLTSTCLRYLRCPSGCMHLKWALAASRLLYMPLPQDSVMQELNARHSASVAAKLDALKQQQQQQQHGQGQNHGTAPWGQQQQGSRQLPGRSLSPGSDFWRQSQQDKQQPASQGLQEVTLQGPTPQATALQWSWTTYCLMVSAAPLQRSLSYRLCIDRPSCGVCSCAGAGVLGTLCL